MAILEDPQKEALEAFGAITEFFIEIAPASCSEELASFLRRMVESTPPATPRAIVYRVVLAQIERHLRSTPGP